MRSHHYGGPARGAASRERWTSTPRRSRRAWTEFSQFKANAWTAWRGGSAADALKNMMNKFTQHKESGGKMNNNIEKHMGGIQARIRALEIGEGQRRQQGWRQRQRRGHVRRCMGFTPRDLGRLAAELRAHHHREQMVRGPLERHSGQAPPPILAEEVGGWGR